MKTIFIVTAIDRDYDLFHVLCATHFDRLAREVAVENVDNYDEVRVTMMNIDYPSDKMIIHQDPKPKEGHWLYEFNKKQISETLQKAKVGDLIEYERTNLSRCIFAIDSKPEVLYDLQGISFQSKHGTITSEIPEENCEVNRAMYLYVRQPNGDYKRLTLYEKENQNDG